MSYRDKIVRYGPYLVWFLEIDENSIISILLDKIEIWKKVLLVLECSRVIPKKTGEHLCRCVLESQFQFFPFWFFIGFLELITKDIHQLFSE